MTTTSLRDAATAFVGVPARPQTYRNLVYLATAFPLGLAYFVFLAFGFSLGVGAAITLVGPPVLVGTLAAVHLLTNVEARLANRLLGTRVPTVAIDTSGGVVSAAKEVVTATRTWVGVAYLLGKFVYGLVAFVALVTSLSLTASLLSAPLTYSTAYRVGLHLGDVAVGPVESRTLVIDTFPEAVGAAAAGLAVGVVSLHLLNGFARLSGAATEALLDTAGTD